MTEVDPVRPELIVDYPFPSRYLARPGGHRLHYVDEGRGEPVVMLHGNPTWGYYYRNLVRALRDRYRCVVPDHIGCGRSDKPSPADYDYSLCSRVADLDALLDHLGLHENLTLVLHDWGGLIGLAWAARHPSRVRRLVVSNTAAFPLPAGKRLPWSLWLARNTRLGAWLVLRGNVFCRAAARWCVARRPLPPAVRQMYLAPYDSPAHRVAVLRFVQTIPLTEADPGFDLLQETARFLPRLAGVPTLLMWGLRDFVFDRHFLDEWRRYLPAAETHVWPDCGHYLLEDAPEEVIPIVRQFLARHSLDRS